jgi:hypothetical protein
MDGFEAADDPRRRQLIAALTAGVFASGFVARESLAATFFGTPPRKLPPEQSIYRLEGDVRVNGAGARLDTAIGPKDTIETGDKSEIVFVVGGNSMIVRSNSVLKLDGGKEESGFFISALRLLSGKLLSVSRNQKHAVTTATATIGIRGTGFYVEADPELTYFCTCYGQTDIASVADPTSSETVTATHHDKPLYITNNAQSGKNVRRAGFINHTDQELMLIETLVGRTPPFVFARDEYSAPRKEY